MLRVGLTGGYATGKSFVANELEQLGAKLIYADKLGHEVLLPGAGAYDAVREIFGETVLDGDGSIDRKRLGERVFGDPDLLKRLTEIVHPAVFKLEETLTARYTGEDARAVVVTEAAILIETGRYQSFDRLIVTVCSEETQIARGMKRDHLSREEILTRLARQAPALEKQAYAHFVVNTDHPKEETAAHVKAIWDQLQLLVKQFPMRSL